MSFNEKRIARAVDLNMCDKSYELFVLHKHVEYDTKWKRTSFLEDDANLCEECFENKKHNLTIGAKPYNLQLQAYMQITVDDVLDGYEGDEWSHPGEEWLVSPRDYFIYCRADQRRKTLNQTGTLIDFLEKPESKSKETALLKALKSSMYYKNSHQKLQYLYNLREMQRHYAFQFDVIDKLYLRIVDNW